MLLLNGCFIESTSQQSVPTIISAPRTPSLLSLSSHSTSLPSGHTPLWPLLCQSRLVCRLATLWSDLVIVVTYLCFYIQIWHVVHSVSNFWSVKNVVGDGGSRFHICGVCSIFSEVSAEKPQFSGHIRLWVTEKIEGGVNYR